ncbi:Transcriptional regulator PadR-like family protein [uncultured archaeon]|nr:Transcriptional regulator PadR-like family protein [uncultured archaeon]
MICIGGPQGVLRMNAMYLLWRIGEKEDYCYALAKALDECEGNSQPSHSRLVRVFLTLKYLEKRGWVRAAKADGDNRARRVYSITPKGKKELDGYKAEVQPILGNYLRYLCSKQ